VHRPRGRGEPGARGDLTRWYRAGSLSGAYTISWLLVRLAPVQSSALLILTLAMLQISTARYTAS
jgi:hypothetical protein